MSRPLRAGDTHRQPDDLTEHAVERVEAFFSADDSTRVRWTRSATVARAPQPNLAVPPDPAVPS